MKSSNTLPQDQKSLRRNYHEAKNEEIPLLQISSLHLLDHNQREILFEEIYEMFT